MYKSKQVNGDFICVQYMCQNLSCHHRLCDDEKCSVWHSLVIPIAGWTQVPGKCQAMLVSFTIVSGGKWFTIGGLRINLHFWELPFDGYMAMKSREKIPMIFPLRNVEEIPDNGSSLRISPPRRHCSWSLTIAMPRWRGTWWAPWSKRAARDSHKGDGKSDGNHQSIESIESGKSPFLSSVNPL